MNYLKIKPYELHTVMDQIIALRTDKVCSLAFSNDTE
jgi:hypothetical protein